MTAWNGFIPVKTKRDTVTHDRNDDGTILDDGEDSKKVKSILEPGPLGRENPFIKKDK